MKQGVMELDIWMDGENMCGKGYGTDAIIHLSDFLHCEYDIKTFFMVPSKKNFRAGFEKTLLGERQKVLESIFTADYLKSFTEDQDYLSDNNWFMVKKYTCHLSFLKTIICIDAELINSMTSGKSCDRILHMKAD